MGDFCDSVLKECIGGRNLGTPYASIETKDSNSIFKELNAKRDLEEDPFWRNFHEVAPVLFGFSAEKDASLSMLRDRWISDEIGKTRTILVSLNKKMASLGENDINLYHLSSSLKVLEDKINILKALRYPSSDKNNLKFQIAGSQKNMVIDISKFMDSITVEHIFTDDELEENKRHEKEMKKSIIQMELPPEDHLYIGRQLEDFKIKIEKGLLDKTSMLKVMKLIGDFAKTKNEIVSHEAQTRRLLQYGKNDNAYIDSIRETLMKEEDNYAYCQNAVLFKGKIPVKQFIASERMVFSNPSVHLDLLNIENSRQPEQLELPELLTRETTIEIVKKANDVAFENYKKLHQKIVEIDRMLTPVIISCLSNDFIYEAYGYPEDVFKAAMIQHKVFEDPDLATFMQAKQFELMQI